MAGTSAEYFVSAREDELILTARTDPIPVRELCLINLRLEYFLLDMMVVFIFT
jgi:hypothetical protein